MWEICALIFTSGILFIFSDNEYILLLSFLIGTIICLHGLIKFLQNKIYLRFSYLLATSLLLFYAVGGLFTIICSEIIPNIDLGLIRNYFGFYTYDHISKSLALVLFVSAILYFISFFEKPIFSDLYNKDSLTDPRVYRIIFLCFIIVIIALLMGEIGYMGVQYDKEIKRISIIGSIAFLIAPIILPMLYLVYLNEKTRSRKLLLILYFIFFLAIVIAFGRRILVFSIFLIIISSQLVPRKEVKKHRNLTKIFLFTIASISLFFLLFYGFKLFYALRLSMVSSREKISFIEVVKESLILFNSSSDFLQAKFLENIIERPFFTISYLSTLFAALSDHSVLLGKEFINSLVISIPSIFFPAKMGVIAATPEEFVHPLLGMPIFDGTNTILTAGLDDFGIIGLIVYPLGLILYYSLIIRITKNRLPLPIYYFVSFSLIFNIISTESALSGLISVSIRNLIISTILFIIIWTIQPDLVFKRTSYTRN